MSAGQGGRVIVPVQPNPHQRQGSKTYVPGTIADREKVVSYLRSTGHYRAHTAFLLDLAETEPSDTQKLTEETLSKVRQTVADAFSTATLPSPGNYETLYVDFRNWARNSLAEFQVPYLMVSYPLLLHIYALLALEQDDPKDACEFLRRHAWEYFSLRGEEIVSLLSTRPDRAGLSLHPVMAGFISNPPQLMSVTIPRLAHQVLMAHLVATKNVLIIEALGRRVKFGYSTSDGLDSITDVCTLAQELTIPSQAMLHEASGLQDIPLRWGLLPEMWNADHTATLDRHRPRNTGAQMGGSVFMRYDREPTDPVTNTSVLPTPQLDKTSAIAMRLMKVRMQGLTKRAEVNAQALPRALSFSVAGMGGEGTSMAVSEGGGHFVAVGSQQGTIRLTCLHSKVQAHRRAITGANGKPVAPAPPAGGNARTQALLNPPGHTCLDLADQESHDHWLMVNDSQLLPETWTKPLDLVGHSGPVTTLDFSPDERLLLSGGVDGSIRLWSPTVKGAVYALPEAHRGPVSQVKWFPHCGYFASCGSDGAARLFAVNHPDGPIREFGVKAPSTVHSVAAPFTFGALRSLAVHPNGTMIVTAGTDRVVRVWDVRAARCCRMLSGASSAGYSVAVSHAGRLVAAGGADGTLGLWDLPTGRLMSSVQAHKDTVSSLDFSYGSQLLASGGVEGTVRLWDVSDGSAGRTAVQEAGGVGAANSSSRVGFNRAVAQPQQPGQVKEEKTTLHPVKSVTTTGGRVGTVKFTYSNLLMVGEMGWD